MFEHYKFCDEKPLSFHHYNVYCAQNTKEYFNCLATFFQRHFFFIIALVIFFYKRKQRKSKQRNPRHHQGNGRVIQNQHVQPSLPTYQYFETENIGTVPSCPNYPPEEFNTELHVGVISYYPPPYVLHDPLQDY